MSLSGHQLLGFQESRAADQEFHGVDPRDGRELDPAFAEASGQEIDRALELAARAFTAMEEISRDRRADFLEQIGEEIMALGDQLITRTGEETGLPTARLRGERGRTVGQLNLFAQVLREGSYVGARLDSALPDRQPLPKPDVRRMLVPLGPVVIFGASNFPLAFSVAGGDTASALAAGCPVVVKGHPNHPGASEWVARAILSAAKKTGMPEGIFSLVQGTGHEVGLALVRHPATRAVGFTGSLRGGRALFDAASARPHPIPVFAEMGSTNPVFLLPGILASDAEAEADGLVASITLGVGQFCTNPGLVFVGPGEAADRFVGRLAERIGEAPEGTMLHQGIRTAFDDGVARLAALDGVDLKARSSAAGDGPCAARPALLTTNLETFKRNEDLREEVFGPVTLVVRCSDDDGSWHDAVDLLDGQLTATVHGNEEDLRRHGAWIRALRHTAGRVLIGGYPTGVEVCRSMQHGGPYPSTTAPATTSVGTAAIERWLRPVAFQGFPQELLPEELKDGNPCGILRLVDGDWSTT